MHTTNVAASMGPVLLQTMRCEWSVRVMGTVLLRRFEYESSDSSREEMKRKFAHTMEFVEEYLRDVVSQPYPFGDKDKNELTLEVKMNWTWLPSARLRSPHTPPSWYPPSASLPLS